MIDTWKVPAWFPYFDLVCAAAAGLGWLIRPELGFWPLVIGLLPWVVRYVLTGRLSVRTSYDIPFLVFLLIALLSIWSAYDREIAWAKFWLIVAAILIYYAYANWRLSGNKGADFQQAWSLTLLGGLTAVFFLVTHDWEMYPAKFPFLTPFGKAIQGPLPELPFDKIHPNIIGGVLAMMVPFGAATTWLSWKRSKPILTFVSMLFLLLIFLGLLLSTTRGAWLGLFVASALLAWWFVTGYLSHHRSRRRLLFFGIPLLFLILLLVVVLVWPSVPEWIIDKLPDSETGIKRGELYANSLILLNDYPLIGAGLGSYMMLYSSYSLLTHVGFITSSHNMYFDIIIDQGLIALAALLWMWLLMGDATWKLIGSRHNKQYIRHRPRQVTSGDPEQKKPQDGGRIRGFSRGGSDSQLVFAAATMSLVVMLVHGIVDDAIYYTRALPIFFLPLAFSVPNSTASAPWTGKQKIQVVGIATLTLLIIAGVWWRPLASIVIGNVAAVYQSKQELGVYEWPEWQIQDDVRRSVDLDKAIANYKQALELNPENASANRRLGQIELTFGEYKKARNHLEVAYQQAPGDNATRQLLGEAYISTGNLQDGVNLWQSVNNGQGQLSLRYFWYGHIGDSERQGAIKSGIDMSGQTLRE